MDQATAKRFFDQLETFSFRALVKLGMNGNESPWGSPVLPHGQPHGAVIHYTADPDMARVLRWFCDPANQAKASAHVVVSPCKESWAEGLDKDLDLVQTLPVTVVQCRRPHEVAWHATWMNASAYGIENVNTGELKQAADGLVWWKPRDAHSGDWTTLYKGDATPQYHYGRYWEPYSTDQLMANVSVLRAVNALFNGTFERSWITGHENVQGVKTVGALGHDKRDPGPHMPLHQLRNSVFTAKPDAIAQMIAAANGPNFAETWRIQAAVACLTAAQLPLNPNDPWQSFVDAATSVHTIQNSRLVCKTMAYVMGYDITTATMPDMTADETGSIYLFQKMMGLNGDGILGPQTREALLERFVDRFAIKLPGTMS